MEFGSCPYVVRRFRDGSDVSKQMLGGAATIHLLFVELVGLVFFLFLNGEADEMADQSLYDLQVVYGPTILVLSLRFPYRLP
jgi:hypothetical protein